MPWSICLLIFLGIANSTAHSPSSQHLHGLTADRERRALLSLWSRWRRLLKEATLVEDIGIEKTYMKTGGVGQLQTDVRSLNLKNVKLDSDGSVTGEAGDMFIRARIFGAPPTLKAFLTPVNGRLKPARTVMYVEKPN